MSKQIFRITENDVYTIMESIIRRIITENNDNRIYRNIWDEIINNEGAENIVTYLDEEGYLDDIYDDLEINSGVSYDELVELPDSELLELMFNSLPPKTIKWCILDVADAFGVEVSEYGMDLVDNEESRDDDTVIMTPDGTEIEDDDF